MCKRYFAQSVFMWGHMMRHHGLPLECAKCANQFYTPAMYLSHKKSCGGSSNQVAQHRKDTSPDWSNINAQYAQAFLGPYRPFVVT